MNCVEMLESLDCCIDKPKKKSMCFSNKDHPLKKRKREENIIMLGENDYINTIDLLNQMKDKLHILENKVENMEIELSKKNGLLDKIHKNYLTKENLKKIKIFSNIEINDHDYFS